MVMETPANDAAFPTKLGGYHGMSLRDYFAAAALTGLIARQGFPTGYASRLAYEFADAMMEAR
jgi:hypothetical protein